MAVKAKKKKILVIGYGGTIVMVIDQKRKAVVPTKNIKEIVSYVPRLHEIANVKMEFMSNKDSTNVTPEDWARLAQYIYSKHDDYDGFVVTHGTNTMAYTASALALSLGPGLKKPVVITGSQLPLMFYGNDARFNFENALKVAVAASEAKIAEVIIVFNDLILRGARSVKVSESAFRAFKSPAFPELGRITSTGIHFGSLVRFANPKAKFELKNLFRTDIVSVDLVPGQLPNVMEALAFSGKCRGIILKSHGAGSVPTDEPYSFIPFIRHAHEKYKIPVIVATKFLGGNAYKEVNDEPAVLAIKAGAIPGGDLTDVMTEVKLMWILGQDVTEQNAVRRMLLTSYVGEVSEIKSRQE